MHITLEPYAWASDLSAEDLGRVVDTYNQVWAEWLPGERPMSAKAFLDLERFTHAPEVVVRRLARDADGTLVAFGQVEWRDGDEGAGIAEIFVAPSARQAGVGRVLGAALARVAREGGRTGLTVQAVEGSAMASMLERSGFRTDLVVEQNRAAVTEACLDMLAGWVAAGEAAPGYSLVAYDAPCPPALAEGFVHARHVMNDAPRFEGEPQATYTVDELRAAEDGLAAGHYDWWSVGVLHDATGELVGLSEVYLPLARPWIAFQGDTGVAPGHRGHRLGAWMKAVNHLRLRSERPAVETIQTWNASANAPMLRINRALGFRPAQTYQAWYLPFA